MSNPTPGLSWSSALTGSGTRQIALVATAVLLISALIGGGYLLLRPNYQVLFSDLRPQDAATIVAELERQKMPYRLAGGGTSVLVPEADVHTARLKVMSRDLPLKGTVGFELFNNADLGLTEFAQKVNYQRALQGELARTIMSLAEIDSARVHLSIPESGLFRRSGAKPRASVALSTRTGVELPPETVRGIQRLVAAAVAELEPHDVTIVDPRGASLSGSRSGETVSDRKLELKIELEQYYARKLAQQLEPIVGIGNAAVSVDVTLNFDQIQITQESAVVGRRIAMPARAGSPDGPTPPPSADPSAPTDGQRARVPLDSGPRRMEQIVAAPGTVKRIAVGVLLQSAQDARTIEQVRQLVGVAAGLSPERGDSVVVFARDRFAAPEQIGAATAPRPVSGAGSDSAPSPAPAARIAVAGHAPHTASMGSWGLLALLVIVLSIALPYWWLRRQSDETPLMNSEQRERKLEQLRQVLARNGAPADA